MRCFAAGFLLGTWLLLGILSFHAGAEFTGAPGGQTGEPAGAETLALDYIPPEITIGEEFPDTGILFQAQTNAVNLFLCRPDRVMQKLTDRHVAVYPSLSPDGRYLFFQSSENPLAEGAQRVLESGELNPLYLYQIYRLDLATGETLRISNAKYLESVPVAAPTGDLVAISSRPPDMESKWRIVLMDMDGKNRRYANPENPSTQVLPTWSPDGSKIAYVSAHPDKVSGQGAQASATCIWLLDLETETSTILPTGENLMVHEPSWSPSGDRIAFTGMEVLPQSQVSPTAGVAAIWIVNTDGSGLEKLTPGPEDGKARWLPDGSKLLFTRKIAESRRSICMLDMKTRKITEILSSPNASLDYPMPMKGNLPPAQFALREGGN